MSLAYFPRATAKLARLEHRYFGKRREQTSFRLPRQHLGWQRDVHGCSGPLGETDPEIRNAWFWPTAWEEVSQHQAHIIVTIFGGNGVKQKALALQRILQLILASIPSTIGVGYPSSGTLLPTSMILQVLEKNAEVAVPLFVSCLFAKKIPRGSQRLQSFARRKD